MWAVLARRASYGGPAPAQIQVQIKALKKILGAGIKITSEIY
jgi:hypothetical protein